MLRQMARPVMLLRSWFGGFRLLLLIIVIVGLAAGLLWERQRRPPLPEGVQATESLVGDVRQTTYRYPGTMEDVRAFYRQALPERGWRYCGTQATEGCTNLIQLVGRSDQAIDVYRRADDQNLRGSTIEVWPVNTENGQTYVTVFETRGQ